jgi:hypothetical protein
MSKKTINVAFILENANHMLSNKEISNDEKSGIVYMLETVLHSSGHYNGYYYLTNEKDEKGELVIRKEGEYNRYYMPTIKIVNEYDSYAKERKNK